MLSFPQTPAARGVLAGVLAFFGWGFMPLFWLELVTISSLEIVAHRIIWSFVFLLCWLLGTKELGKAWLIMRQPKALGLLACSSALLGGNWLLYIWAVNDGQVLATSLGYFINPLLNVLLGRFLFGEKASPLAWCAIGLAFFGVAYQVVVVGAFPFVALGLGTSFAVYGALRKTMLVETVPALLVETSVLLPPALLYALWLWWEGSGSFGHATGYIHMLFVLLGVVTTVPLLLFTFAARNIKLTTLGLLQYLAPSTVFLLGVFVLHEPLHAEELVTFACIWAAIGLYTWESLRQHRKKTIGNSLQAAHHREDAPKSTNKGN